MDKSLAAKYFKKVRGSFASYKDTKGECVCDLFELSKQLMNWGEIPLSIGDVKAMELSLLAEGYLRASKARSK